MTNRRRRHNSENERLVAAYLEHLGSRRYAEASLRTYRFALDKFLKGIPAPLRDLSPRDLERFRGGLLDQGLSPATVGLLLRTVRSLYRWLEGRRLVFLNPAEGLLAPAPRRVLMPVPTEEEVARLLERPDTGRPTGLRDRAMMEVAYGCGLRRQELCTLRVGDVDLEQGLVRVRGKGGKERMAPLGPHAAGWVRRYLAEGRGGAPEGPGERLWIGARGRPLSGQGFAVMLKTHARHAKIATPVTPHSLRRACATHLLNRGAHPVELQLLLGHASLRHLSQYLQVGVRELKRTHARSRPGR